MDLRHMRITRRAFLRTAALGAVAAGLDLTAPRGARTRIASMRPARVSLTRGDSRGDNVFRALELIREDVKQSLATKKRVLIKPNMVSQYTQLSATHVDCIEAILEFLQPLVKGEILIAESPGEGPSSIGYENYGYYSLQKKYKVRFLELDNEPTVTTHVIDQRYRPQTIRFSQLLSDPDVFVISAAVMKTHDCVVTTLSLKNVAVGGAIKDKNFRWGRRGQGKSDKVTVHGGPRNEAIHYNLFTLAKFAPPDLAIIDGFRGMERNGPVAGTPVDHRVAMASTDWLAADRVAVELMGFDFKKIGYLWFSTRAGLGQGDLSRIEVPGERIQDSLRRYRPHDNIESQYRWMKSRAFGLTVRS